ncbi:MAG TPA: hypothetical protein VFM27_01040 [Acidimicrobiales bacterium]|nr:hypothetical protein [Acidimicrobiales bacterium]
MEEPLVHLPRESDRHGEATTNTSEAVLHRDDVVADLGSIVRRLGRRNLARLEPQELADVGPGALDPGAQHGFQAKVGADEKVGIGDEATDATEPVHRTGCLVEELDDLVREGESTGHGGRDERPVPGLGPTDLATLARHEGIWSHPDSWVRRLTFRPR